MPLGWRTFGDDVAREVICTTGKRADPPPPPTAAGYEVVFRLQSTSTLILLASLSSPQEFVQRATADTAFWSFYFGAVASGVALWLALAAASYGASVFLAQLSAGGRPARLRSGFSATYAALPFQDFMISSLSCSAMLPPSGCTARF